MKLNREALAHYLDTKWTKKVTDVATAVFEIIGDDIEEMSVEMNPDTSQVKNILGQTKTVDNGFAPTVSADPWYADPEKGIYDHLRDIALEQLKGDERKTLMLEVVVEDTEALKAMTAEELAAVVEGMAAKAQALVVETDVTFQFSKVDNNWVILNGGISAVA